MTVRSGDLQALVLLPAAVERFRAALDGLLESGDRQQALDALAEVRAELGPLDRVLEMSGCAARDILRESGGILSCGEQTVTP